MLKLVGDSVSSIEEFMARYRVSTLHLQRSLSNLDVSEDGSSCSTTSTEGRRTSNSRTLERSGARNEQMGCGDHAGMLSYISQLHPRNPRNASLQSFITFMDALKLRLRAKDQLHPLLQELVTSFSRFKGSKDWEGRSRLVGW
jgi:hypothetical protein